MDTSAYSPVIGGIIGGILGIWVVKLLARWVPQTCGERSVAEITAENRSLITSANALFFVCLGLGILSYKMGYFQRSDWRGFALVVGAACVAPVALLFIATIGQGRVRMKEALVAFAVSQRLPPPLLYAFVALGFVSLFAALAAISDA